MNDSDSLRDRDKPGFAQRLIARMLGRAWYRHMAASLRAEVRRRLADQSFQDVLMEDVKNYILDDRCKRGVLRGVLTETEIRRLKIIEDGDERYFKPTSYDLRLGKLCYVRGNPNRGLTRLGEGLQLRSIEIKPFSTLAFETAETVKMPAFVVGRFDLKIKHAMKGLFLQVGPQVEPHYHGKLFGLLVNTSAKSVELCLDRELLAIEFSYTTAPVGPQPGMQPCMSLVEFLSHVGSGYADLANESVIEKLQADVTKLKVNWSMFGLTISVIVMVAATFLGLWWNEKRSADDLRQQLIDERNHGAMSSESRTVADNERARP